jgi:hypothetical protein
MIRVGTTRYSPKGTRSDPVVKGFTPIVCLTKSTKYGNIGPYVLTNEKGQIFENFWQAHKVYPEVPYMKVPYSRYDSRIIFEHPAEKHVTLNQDRSYTILPNYWSWRNKIMSLSDPLRYPVGKNRVGDCLFALMDDGKTTLNYIQARKEIYLKEYCRLVKQTPTFQQLEKRLKDGENLLIIEVDGPRLESQSYYDDEYGQGKIVIDPSDEPSPTFSDKTQPCSILVNEENMEILLNDPKHPFGHGYCLAMALMGYDIDKFC